MQLMFRNITCGAATARRAMSRTSFIVGLVLWTLVLGALYLVAVKKLSNARSGAGSPKLDAQVQPGETTDDEHIEATPKSVGIRFPSRELPQFEVAECMGGTVSRDSMKGKRWLANFIFTRCAGPCPLMTRDISELHRLVAKSNPEFQFISFSVDPQYDTVDVLKKYAETFQADHARWKFVTCEESAMHDLIRGGFTQYVQPNLGDLRKPGFEVAHSNRAVLVNEEGIPVGSFVMTIPEDVAKLRRIIEGKDEFPTPTPGLSFSVTNGENPHVPLTLVPVEDVSTGSESDKAAADEEPPSENSENETEASNSPQTPQAKNEKIDELLPEWAARMPAVNAGLNSGCIVLLLSGLAAIKAGNRITHRNLMIAAFVASIFFLASYLAYHEALFRFTGFRGRAFEGSPAATLVYFSILIPHVILAALVPVLALRVFYLAFKERWPEHRRLAKITLPVWLFVSITGVIIYGMLYHWPWPNVLAPVNSPQ